MNLCLKKIITSFFLVYFLSFSSKVYALNPRVKTLGSIALYGTVGGALLGTAVMAFGAAPRSIAKGASLGLYAGIIFGGYVVVGHMMKSKAVNNEGGVQAPYYPEGEYSPYESEEEGSDDSIYQGDYEERWNPYTIFELDREKQRSKDHFYQVPSKFIPTIYVPLFYLNF